MKFGIDPPWYDDPVERLAFNLYAITQSQFDNAAKELAEFAKENGDLPMPVQHYICHQCGFDLNDLSDNEIALLSREVERRLE